MINKVIKKKVIKLIKITLILLFLLSFLMMSYVLYQNKDNINTMPIDSDQENTFVENSKNTIEKNDVSTKLSVAEVIKKNERYIVQVVCMTNEYDVQASGVVMGTDFEDNLIVLTNYHVIEDLKKLPNNPSCSVKYSDGGLSDEYYYAEPIFWDDKISKEDMWLIDFAFLQVKKVPKIGHTYVDDYGNKTSYEQTTHLLSMVDFPSICSQDKLKIGKDILILGFPGISNVDVPGVEFNSVFTATEGIISEKISNSDYYFNTSAKIDSGNSGGGAFLRDSGCLAGIPTFVVSGGAESMGKILNANNLKRDFLDSVLDTSNIYSRLFKKSQ